MKVLVVGATGLLGSEVCRRLVDAGRPVRALVRTGSPRAGRLDGLAVERAAGDLKDPSSLAAACRGAGAVITTANTMMSAGRGDSFAAVEDRGQADLLAAATAAGVDRFIYVGHSPAITVDSPFTRAKRRFERRVMESTVPWTVLQPTAFMETTFSPAAGWDLARGRVAVIRPGTRPVSFVSLHDVAAFAVAALDEPQAAGRALPLGGPEALTPLQAVAIFEEVLGRDLKVRLIPAWIPRALRRFLPVLSPRLASLAALAEAGASGDVIAMDGTLKLLPVRQTSLRDFAARQVR